MSEDQWLRKSPHCRGNEIPRKGKSIAERWTDFPKRKRRPDDNGPFFPKGNDGWLLADNFPQEGATSGLRRIHFPKRGRRPDYGEQPSLRGRHVRTLAKSVPQAGIPTRFWRRICLRRKCLQDYGHLFPPRNPPGSQMSCLDNTFSPWRRANGFHCALLVFKSACLRDMVSAACEVETKL